MNLFSESEFYPNVDLQEALSSSLFAEKEQKTFYASSVVSNYFITTLSEYSHFPQIKYYCLFSVLLFLFFLLKAVEAQLKQCMMGTSIGLWFFLFDFLELLKQLEFQRSILTWFIWNHCFT